MSDEVISVESLKRTFGRGSNEKVAVNSISFDVKKGEIFGILGPNGAGKTTTIRMLSTLLIPTSGKAVVLGVDVSLRHDDKGAPIAVATRPMPHLSISHTAGLVCLACNTGHPIGIDVERYSERILRVRSRFLHNDEMAAISPDDITANLIAWTAKEALYKVGGNTRTNFAGDIRLQHFDATQDAPITLQASCHDVPHHVTTILTASYVFSIAVEASRGIPLPENNYQNTNIIAL